MTFFIKDHRLILLILVFGAFILNASAQEESSVEVESGSLEQSVEKEIKENIDESNVKKEKSPYKKPNIKKDSINKSSLPENPILDTPLTVIDFEYEHPEKSFKMQVPSDWDVKKDYNGYELFMEPKIKMVPTAENPVAADPNISVKVLNKTVYLDQKGLEDYEKEIIQKFNEANGVGSNFQIFQKTLFDLTPTTRALLYDVTFTSNNYEIFQTIIVLASEGRMYRLTLTDYKVFFDKNREKYFPILASVQIEGKAPSRENALMKFLPFGLGLIVAGLLVIGVYFMRRRRTAQAIELSNEESENYSHAPSYVQDNKHSVSDSIVSKHSSSPVSIAESFSHQNSNTHSVNPESQMSGFEGENQESMPLSQAVGQNINTNKKQKNKDKPEKSGFDVSHFDD